LIALFGWRAIFLVNLPIGLTGLWLTFRHADETRPAAQREIDLPGQLCAIAAAGSLAGALVAAVTIVVAARRRSAMSRPEVNA
jgi:DHA2 family methylenomycin A resistance protein-like MFS transporter